MHEGLLTCEVTERRKVGHGIKVPCIDTLTALHVQVHWAQKLVNIIEQLTYLQLKLSIKYSLLFYHGSGHSQSFAVCLCIHSCCRSATDSYECH